MVSVDKAVIARLKREGKNFEILVDCEKAIEFKQGKSSLEDAVVTFDIFEDVKKGLHASEHDMEKIFETKDKQKVSEIIIKKGDIQLTTEYQNKLREEKKKHIVNLIHRNAINPQTNAPHPPQRIENAIGEAKVNIDYFKSAEEQVQEIIKQINAILPIKYEIREISIKIPSQYAGQSFTILKQFGKVLRDDWQSDGSLLALVEVPAGLQNELFDKLNNLTHGSIETKIVKTK